MANNILIYLTAASEDEAIKISRTLLEKKLIACSNIFSAHKAMYLWDGEVSGDTEFSLILKTKASLFEKVEKEIIKIHSYKLPCIIAWPIERGHIPFLNWIEDQTQ